MAVASNGCAEVSAESEARPLDVMPLSLAKSCCGSWAVPWNSTYASSGKKPKKTKEQKLKAALSGGKGRKKKGSKGKVKEKMLNAVLFDKATYDKMMKEIPKTKLITPAVVSERCKINGSLARQAIRHLEGEGLISAIDTHHSLLLYSRKIQEAAA